jgi:hypothetical protein
MGTDPDHLGSSGADATNESGPGDRGIDWREPVQEPPDRDDPAG